MTTTIFAKNVQDLVNLMLHDTKEDGTYTRYTIESYEQKIYADPEAGIAWREKYWNAREAMAYDSLEMSAQQRTEWFEANPEPNHIIFTFWYLEYRFSKWHVDRIINLPPELGQQIDNNWNSRWDEVSRTSRNVGTLTMATILKRVGVEVNKLIRERKQELRQERVQRSKSYEVSQLERTARELEESIQSFSKLGVGNLSGLMSHLLSAQSQIKLAMEVVDRDCK